MAERRCPRRADRGSAAVEFALVVPILLALVFGIVDYGLYFSNTLGARSGARDAARHAVVEIFEPTNCNGLVVSGNDYLKSFACLAVTSTAASSGETYAQVTAGKWKQGEDVVVCVVIAKQGLTGLTPLPDGGTIRTTLQLQIEQDTVGSKGSGRAGTNGTSPPGGWC